VRGVKVPMVVEKLHALEAARFSMTGRPTCMKFLLEVGRGVVPKKKPVGGPISLLFFRRDYI
jgi:hypothetical protein